MGDRILIFSRSLPVHHIGGMEIVAWDMATSLARKGYQVTLITTSCETSKLQEKINGLNIHIINNAAPGKYSKNWWIGTERIMQDLIPFSSSIKAVISVSAAGFRTTKFKSVFSNTAFIMQAHGTSWGEFISKWKKPGIKRGLFSLKNIKCFLTDALYYKNFDSIIAVGSTVEEQLKRVPTRLIIDVNKIKRIENGIDNELFTDDLSFRKAVRNELNIPCDAFVCISVSRLHHQKGVDDNIHAFKKIIEKNSNSYYLICGSGNEQALLEQLVAKYNLTDRVLFLGAKKRHELTHLMACSDVFLFLTNHTEVGLPLNVLEAMSSGLPQVISKHLPCERNDKVRQVDPWDYDSAANAAIEIFAHAQNLKRSSYISCNNTLDSSINEYIKLFELYD